MSRVDYLLAELRCASLRARLWQATGMPQILLK